MDYSSKIRIESKKFAGVSFTILKMTYRRRAELRELQSEANAKLRAIQDLMAPLAKEYREAVDKAKAAIQPMAEEPAIGEPMGPVDFPEDKLEELVKYSDQVRRIDVEELTPIATHFALVEIEGLMIDDIPATLDQLRACGPDSLYDELAEAVQAEIELSQAERENLRLPSTSAAAVDGNGRAGSAIPAGRPVTITTKDARSSTDPESAIARATVAVQ